MYVSLEGNKEKILNVFLVVGDEKSHKTMIFKYLISE